MYLLTKHADDLAIVFSPSETLRLGETLKIDDIIAQVVDIQFADLPGVLEHILRKSLITQANTEEHLQPEVQSVADSLTDQKVAFAKIRGRIVNTKGEDGSVRPTFKTGLSEFNISRANADIQVLGQQDLFTSLHLTFPDTCDLCTTLSRDQQKFDVLVDKLGINLITGMKGSGKSYLAKRLLLKLIDQNILTVAFDLNAEYLDLRKADDGKLNDYAERMVTFTPYLAEESGYDRRLMIPPHEITFDDFATFLNVTRDSAMYLYLIQFWRKNSTVEFTLDDLERFIKTRVDNDYARAGLLVRVDVARESGLFGPNNVTECIKTMHKTGGAILFNLADINHWERTVVVEFILRKLVKLGQSREVEAISLFLEEAQLYVEQQNMIDILTRMRHSGIFPTFITNTPRTLPDDVYTLLDNLIAFTFRNEDELRHLSRSGLIDQKSINALQHLERRQCIAVGKISSNYPLFIEVTPQTGALMGGETRELSPQQKHS
jgi:hypothetical protein